MPKIFQVDYISDIELQNVVKSHGALDAARCVVVLTQDEYVKLGGPLSVAPLEIPEPVVEAPAVEAEIPVPEIDTIP